MILRSEPKRGSRGMQGRRRCTSRRWVGNGRWHGAAEGSYCMRCSCRRRLRFPLLLYAMLHLGLAVFLAFLRRRVRRRVGSKRTGKRDDVWPRAMSSSGCSPEPTVLYGQTFRFGFMGALDRNRRGWTLRNSCKGQRGSPRISSSLWIGGRSVRCGGDCGLIGDRGLSLARAYQARACRVRARRNHPRLDCMA